MVCVWGCVWEYVRGERKMKGKGKIKFSVVSYLLFVI